MSAVEKGDKQTQICHGQAERDLGSSGPTVLEHLGEWAQSRGRRPATQRA